MDAIGRNEEDREEIRSSFDETEWKYPNYISSHSKHTSWRTYNLQKDRAFRIWQFF